MLVGHYAIAFLAKRAERRISLGTLVLAAMIADFAWCVFMIAGFEHVQYKPEMGAGRYFAATNIALSHSLAMDVLWAALCASAYFLRQRYPRGAWILFLVALSHWFLDFVSHKTDMPIAPGIHRYVGLGLWTSIPATVMVEGGLWCLAIILYVRITHPRTAAGIYVFWAGIVFLTLIWLNNIAGPPPRDIKTAPFASLILFSLTVAWAYWVNRLRPAVG